MLKAKINGKPIEIETSWEEIKFGKFLKLLDARDDYNYIISILLDTPLEEVKKAKFVGLDAIIKSIQFLKKPAEVDEFPTKLGHWTIPKDITFETVEQFETMRTKIFEAAKSDDMAVQTKYLAHYAAIYCQPLDGEDFDAEKAEWLVPKMMELPCLEVMGAGSFFMAKWLSIQSGLSMSFLRRNIPMKRSRLASRIWQKISGFMQRLTMWLGM